MRIFYYMTILVVFVLCSARAQESSPTIEKIKRTGVVTIGYIRDYEPFSYESGPDQARGYTIDICNRIVDALKTSLNLPNLQIRYSPVTTAMRLPLIINGSIDLECSATTNNAERQQKVAFSNSFFVSAIRFVALKDANLRQISDLKGKIVTTTAGTTSLKPLHQLNDQHNYGMIILPSKDDTEGFHLVETKRADAYVMDDILLAGQIANSKDPNNFIISTDAFSLPEPYGIMLRRDDAAFKAVVDQATATLYASAEIEAIYARWFLQPIPPRGINMNTPMSAHLKKAYRFPSDSPDPAHYIP